MRIRNKILAYFSSTVIALIGLTLIIINVFFSAHREEEFQQRQKEKIVTTLKFLSEVKETDEMLIEAMDKLTINDLYDEKLLLFDSKKQLIYSSVDDTPIPISKEMLSELNVDNKWIETKDGKYDVVGTYIDRNGTTFYGISKAYDAFGYSKLTFLRRTLLMLFFVISLVVVGLSVFLAQRIAKPIKDLAELADGYVLTQGQLPRTVETTTYEIELLNGKFNELLQRIAETFAFQKHSIHHISHQLKTPLAVIVSELERLRDRTEEKTTQRDLDVQISKTRSLADTINVLLHLSKVEAGQQMELAPVRIDEIVFDSISELIATHPDFRFEVNYLPTSDPEADRLVLNTNEMLLKQVFLNLLNNCIAYGDTQRAEVRIDCSSAEMLTIAVINSGPPLTVEEQKYAFSHFFRGENSRGVPGSGLGLALAQKIIDLHGGNITYANPSSRLNLFTISFPLS